MKQSSNYCRVALFMTGFVFTLAACNNGESEGSATNTSAADSTQSAEATLNSVYPDTTVNGTARFEQSGNGRVKLNINLTVPAKANQSVAVHIHENGSCENNAGAAGGHWNPTGENHGRWGQGAFHSGDIGNINLDGEGKGSMELETDRWSIGGEQQKNILNKAVIVHSGVDDYTSQPSGNAGNRIGCGVIGTRNQ